MHPGKYFNEKKNDDKKTYSSGSTSIKQKLLFQVHLAKGRQPSFECLSKKIPTGYFISRRDTNVFVFFSTSLGSRSLPINYLVSFVNKVGFRYLVQWPPMRNVLLLECSTCVVFRKQMFYHSFLYWFYNMIEKLHTVWSGDKSAECKTILHKVNFSSSCLEKVDDTINYKSRFHCTLGILQVSQNICWYIIQRGVDKVRKAILTSFKPPCRFGEIPRDLTWLPSLFHLFLYQIFYSYRKYILMLIRRGADSPPPPSTPTPRRRSL